MTRRLRKVLAFGLSAWLLLLGNVYTPAFGAEIQHDLELVQIASDAPANTDGACRHGCAGHFSAHLVAISDDAPAQSLLSRKSALNFPPGIFSASSLPDRFFPPPKLSLA